ncbi:uncharacterized protein LOC124942139 [Impatiens glandulifera]|uniref:uncharacterized protein LOC124942139 n=1 Tax=Impatiens glandulifera TaxID=253017 RepID=UPI001FB1A221|nr:uncharacterized protein LOC124942139 [Impatiens glandulifera]
MEDERSNTSLLPSFTTTKEGIALKSFKSFLTWICLDQSNPWKTTLSYSIFFLLTIAIPILNHIIYASCKTCDSHHLRPYDSIIQLSLFSVSTLSFLCLSSFTHNYGIKRFLFLDKLGHSSDKVRQGYVDQLQRSAKILASFVLPIFVIDGGYKIWWFVSAGNVYVYDMIACVLQMCSWLYRTAIFFVVCVLFRLICYLQILKLEEFARVFEKESDVGNILTEHLKIRRNLRIISHRFRVFVLMTVVLVTMSQLASLLVTTKAGSTVDVYTAGELALCSITLVTGLFICLRSATKITHRAQSITSLATKWHVCATINSFDDFDGNTPTTPSRVSHTDANWDSDNDGEEENGDDDDLDNTKMIPIFSISISYQKRQALVNYFEQNKAGITVFGFVLDRTSIHMMFVIQMSLTLWLLNKTIGFS